MPTINVTVRNKIAAAAGPVYICGNSDYTVAFSFDAEWAEYETKTARFVYAGGYQDVVFTGSECAMPIISDTNAILIGVFAGNLHTTTAARIPAQKSILCGCGSPAKPPEDVYAQIMEILNDARKESESINKETRQNATIAQNAANNAGKSETNALAAADRAENYSINPPYPASEVWHIWNGTEYVATNEPSRGEKGDKGDQGIKGDKGDKGDTGADGVNGKDGAPGKDGVVDYSLVANALKGNASGEVISLDDVSPLEHMLKVKASAEDGIDLSQSKVIVTGKNLYNNVEYGYKSGNVTATKTATGYSLTGADSNANWILIPLCSLTQLGGKKVTAFYDIVGSANPMRLVVCDTEYGNRAVIYEETTQGEGHIFTLPKPSEYPEDYIVVVRLNGDKTSDPTKTVTYSNIQIELGEKEKKTAYEPFKTIVEYPVNADGTAQGVQSIAPNMTITNDTGGVVLDVAYNKDTNKVVEKLINRIAALESAVI